MPTAPVSIAAYVEQAETHARHPGLPAPRSKLAWARWYARYLASEDWAARRQAVLERDGFRCQRAGCAQPAAEVHHLTYARAGREPLSDLISLCADHHRAIHGFG